MRIPLWVAALRLRSIVYVSALAISLPAAALYAESSGDLSNGPTEDVNEFKITKTEYTLVLNTDQQEAPLEVEPKTAVTDSTVRAGFNIQMKNNSAPSIASFDKDTLTLKGLAAGTTKIEIAYKPTPSAAEKTTTVTVTVQRRVKEIVLTSPALATDEKLVLIQGEKRNVTVALKGNDGKDITDGGIKLSSDKQDVVKIEKDGNQDVLLAKQPGTATVTIQATDKQNASFDLLPKVEKQLQVEVKEAIQSITVTPENIAIKQGDEFTPNIKLKGTSGKDFEVSERQIKGVPDKPLVLVDDKGKLSAVFGPQKLERAEQVKVTYFNPEGVGAKEVQSNPITVTVYPRGAFITFSRPSLVLTFGGQSDTVTAIVHQEDGTEIRSAIVSWDLNDRDTASKYIALSPQGNTVTVTSLNKPEDPSDGKPVRHPNSFKVKASYTVPGTQGASVITNEFLVRLVEPTTFSPLKVKLNIMDENTASDLYGRITANEYYVAQVRLYNNLKDEKSGKYLGASILAFSASIEVGVGLEKKYDKDSNSFVQSRSTASAGSSSDNKVDDKKWHPVNDEDLNSMVDPMPRGRQAEAPRSDNGKLLQEEKQELEDFPCRSLITYRPLTFEMMVNTVDRRDDRSFRSRVFKGLSAFGTAFSFVTAVAQPGANSDLPIGLEKYSNLFIPGLEKLWPSLKEPHRQNIVSQTMKPFEEVPFGSDISRVLFFPKKPIRGMLRGHLVRVSQICPYAFKVEVAIVDRNSKTTVTNQGAQPQ
ncbi:MAG: hypothetical protein AABN33_01895 [Acidobacteriota bacterium]